MNYEYCRDFFDYFNIGRNIAEIHCHKSIEIVYVLKNNIKITINDRVYLLREKELAFIPPYAVHSFDPDNTAITQVNTLPAKYSEIYMQALGSKLPVTQIIQNKAVADDVAKHLRRIAKNPSDIMKTGIYNYCIAEFLENVEKQNISKNGKEAHADLFYRVLLHIDENYNKKITLDDLAKKFGYSRFYFSCMFNANLHTNLKNYINNVRISKSTELLKSNSVTKTASLVGYSNLQSFFLNFKRLKKCTPKEYMEKLMTKK
ncbi:MAG: AraC family transcriptional regulator [Eubacteriales bacterium]|nr:AraC family transcriptional regulator [Eubacteriales bacterium]